MKLKRREPWGYLIYDTQTHDFDYERSSRSNGAIPYTTQPIVLCAYLSFACNLRCAHCVVRDFGISDHAGSLDQYDDGLISAINSSPFLVVDITGGEPLLPKLEGNLVNLLLKLHGKGLMLDTNGTCFPSQRVLSVLRKKHVLVRVSWDSLNPNEEAKLRCYPKGLYNSNESYLRSKIETIHRLRDSGVQIAVQTVLSGVNRNDKKLKQFPLVLASLGIKEWYIQRYIPAHKVKDRKQYLIGVADYERLTDQLCAASQKNYIKCRSKRDRRHNSVFLLTQDGQIYTQDDGIPGKKIRLGNFKEVTKSNSFFEIVSVTDHSDRYYARQELMKGDSG